jgi:hypothetical protein
MLLNSNSIEIRPAGDNVFSFFIRVLRHYHEHYTISILYKYVSIHSGRPESKNASRDNSPAPSFSNKEVNAV